MIDNARDKGYIQVHVKQQGNEFYLCEMGFTQDPADLFYVDYENGTIYIDEGNGKRDIIGYYAPCANGPYAAEVYNASKSRVIGLVGGELIRFRAYEPDYSVGRYLPEEKTLANWNERNGNITPHANPMCHVGYINGSEVGGAAAFIALFYAYRFNSIYRDYFVMETSDFNAKYSSAY